jgi:hypothetical protein
MIGRKNEVDFTGALKGGRKCAAVAIQMPGRGVD